MGQLTGKVAVVVGASGQKNFGSSIARRLAAAGAKVVVSARRKEPLEELATEIGGLAVACDVTDESQIANLFSTAKAEFGSVDIAVNSAGGMGGGPIADVTAEDMLPTLQVSFMGAILIFKHAAAAMDNGGSIITISSLTARLPGPGLGIYAGARAGIDYALKVAAIEYAEQKIRFNSIAAGLIETDMTAGLFAVPGLVDGFTSVIPAGRMGTVDDVAEAALWLADEKASGFVNGQLIDLAGGQQMGRLPG
ncbi:SDR family oxidoreductase [Halieaceae bacterium IMCC14734]|uniref:SDR family oxidoreductase n=1 Tax=Candidatus Litorirhabdus singularis TaxID=2518993 RepID=A0ABT3TD07_9GAMM|nr:SDR family oxidoreductase [Candidatus Litorirhabdus singularis]MCX2980182.1 SDR family oxidoreductase [Candidatus Litorirhabdus singularis]